MSPELRTIVSDVSVDLNKNKINLYNYEIFIYIITCIPVEVFKEFPLLVYDSKLDTFPLLFSVCFCFS